MRIFGSDRMDGMLQKLGLKEGEAIVHPWINKAVERAQKKVEARNFDIRKNVLKYDDVLNDQRKVIFDQRVELMESKDLSEFVGDMRHDVIEDLVARHIPERAYAEQWDADGLKTGVANFFDLDMPVHDWVKEEGIAEDDIRARLMEAAEKAAAEKAERFGPEIRRWTIFGASTSSTSTTCARLSASAATRSAIRCRNTRPRLSSCSSRC